MIIFVYFRSKTLTFWPVKSSMAYQKEIVRLPQLPYSQKDSKMSKNRWKMLKNTWKYVIPTGKNIQWVPGVPVLELLVAFTMVTWKQMLRKLIEKWNKHLNSTCIVEICRTKIHYVVLILPIAYRANWFIIWYNLYQWIFWHGFF